MITLRTLIKKDDGFVPISEFTGPLENARYIEGALELWIDGKELLSTRHWDLIDQMWAYLARGMAQVKEGQPFSTYFPDQPVLLSMHPLPDGKRVEVKVDQNAAVLPTRELLDAMVSEAAQVFRELIRLVPVRAETYRRLLDEVEKL